MPNTRTKSSPLDQPRGGLLARPPAESIKETIDSIIVALCLALVFRAFIVEAFVIPTGSMADTLMGEHREAVCANCGYAFNIEPSKVYDDPNADAEARAKDAAVICPNCEWNNALNPRDNPNRGGDKILVFKFPYLFDEPKRWDVVVFYNPADPDENFIKRLIGSPGERIQIRDGDIYTIETVDGKNIPHIQRKPDEVQQTLWRPVYLNDCLPANRVEAMPAWSHGKFSGWSREEPGKTEPAVRKFTFSPVAGVTDNNKLTFRPGSYNLGFRDYFSYDRNFAPPGSQDASSNTLNLVSDLKLQFVVFFREPGAAVSMSTNRGDVRFTAKIHQGGLVELFKSDAGRLNDEDPKSRVDSRQLAPFALNRGVQVALQNVDFRATVWVDGRQVALKDYDPPDDKPDLMSQPSGDHPEVWIKAYDKPLEIWHVNLYRDVYYTAILRKDVVDRGTPGSREPIVELKKYGTGSERDSDDEFFVCGDNSPSSSDGRLWGPYPPDKIDPYWHLRDRMKQGAPHPYRFGRVPRDHLIGRAFFVYWPAGLGKLPISIKGLRYIPNVGRMRLIH